MTPMEPIEAALPRHGYRARELTVGWGDMSVAAATGPQDEDSGWRRIDGFAHSIHYQSGPVPYLEVRPVDTDDRRRVPCGSVVSLDVDRAWEVKAPANLYGSTDVLLDTAGPPGPANKLIAPCVCRLDVERAYRGEPDVGVSFEAAVPVGAGGIVLDVPIRGLKKGYLYFEVVALVAPFTLVPVAIVRPRASSVFQPVTAQFTFAGALTPPMSTLADRRVIEIGEDFYLSTSEVFPLATPVWALPSDVRAHGYMDRLRVHLFHTAGTGSARVRVGYSPSNWNLRGA